MIHKRDSRVKMRARSCIFSLAIAGLLPGTALAQTSDTLTPPAHAVEPQERVPGDPGPQPGGGPPPELIPVPDSRREFFRALAKGLYVRESYAAKDTLFPVEVWNVVVAPGQTKAIRFPGAVVFEVIDGGVIVVRPKRGKVRTGETFSVKQGEAVVLRNDGKRSATLRAIIIGGTQ